MPVRRLHAAGWPVNALFTSWVLYAVGTLAAVRFPGMGRLLVPVLVIAYVAPFVAGPERLARMLGRRPADRRRIIDVTPPPAPGLPEPPRDVTPSAGEDDGNLDSGTGRGGTGRDEPSR